MLRVVGTVVTGDRKKTGVNWTMGPQASCGVQGRAVAGVTSPSEAKLSAT